MLSVDDASAAAAFPAARSPPLFVLLSSRFISTPGSVLRQRSNAL